MVITFESSVEILSVTIQTIQIKTTTQFFPVAPYIMLKKVVLVLETVGKILTADSVSIY